MLQFSVSRTRCDHLDLFEKTARVPGLFLQCLEGVLAFLAAIPLVGYAINMRKLALLGFLAFLTACNIPVTRLDVPAMTLTYGPASTGTPSDYQSITVTLAAQSPQPQTIIWSYDSINWQTYSNPVTLTPSNPIIYAYSQSTTGADANSVTIEGNYTLYLASS